jgi:HEPN domain-containing protein
MSELVNGTKEWIEKADHDLGSAKVIYLHLPDYFDTIAFHCQQSVEKYIKAALFFNKIEFQRSHDLIYLLELLSGKIDIDERWYKIAVSLNNFSVQIRYPNTIIKLSKEEIESSIQIAEDFRKFAIELTEIE